MEGTSIFTRLMSTARVWNVLLSTKRLTDSRCFRRMERSSCLRLIATRKSQGTPTCSLRTGWRKSLFTQRRKVHAKAQRRSAGKLLRSLRLCVTFAPLREKKETVYEDQKIHNPHRDPAINQFSGDRPTTRAHCGATTTTRHLSRLGCFRWPSYRHGRSE